MALYRYTSHELPPDENGRVWEEIDGREETPCARCGEEAFSQTCPGDGRYHHHGCVHTMNDDLIPVCNECIRDVEAEWAQAREIRAL